MTVYGACRVSAITFFASSFNAPCSRVLDCVFLPATQEREMNSKVQVIHNLERLSWLSIRILQYDSAKNHTTLNDFDVEVHKLEDCTQLVHCQERTRKVFQPLRSLRFPIVSSSSHHDDRADRFLKCSSGKKFAMKKRFIKLFFYATNMEIVIPDDLSIGLYQSQQWQFFFLSQLCFYNGKNRPVSSEIIAYALYDSETFCVSESQDHSWIVTACAISFE